MLFYSRLGCGKTLLAKVIANKCGANFISIFENFTNKQKAAQGEMARGFKFPNNNSLVSGEVTWRWGCGVMVVTQVIVTAGQWWGTTRGGAAVGLLWRTIRWWCKDGAAPQW